jgi:uncharacterized protein
MLLSKSLVTALFVGISLIGMALSQEAIAPLPAARFGATENVVTLVSQGQKIVGTWTVPAGATAPYPTVLMLHGFLSTRQELPVNNTKETMFSRTARILAEQGFASLRIDFRGSGESEGKWEDTTFSSQMTDARAAIAFLNKQANVDTKKIAVLGMSQGGLVAASIAATERSIRSLVLWSPVSSPAQTFSDMFGSANITKGLASNGQAINIKLPWGAETQLKTGFFEDLFKINPIAEIAIYSRPLLVVVGKKDTTVTPQPLSGQLYLNYHRGEEKLVVLDADHVFGIFGTGPEHLDEGISESVRWLEKTL